MLFLGQELILSGHATVKQELLMVTSGCGKQIFAHTEYERMVTAMDDYIKREALRDALYDADAITMNGVKIINQFPSSDVEPVKHGQWIGSGDGYANGELVYDMWECSECGYDADGADEEPNWNYCPNCGARMDDV